MRTGQRGSATLFAVSCVALLLLVGAALGVVAAMFRAHRAAEAAADLAALSGAAAAQRGAEPCAAAHRIATANGASLAGCRVTGGDVWARVTVPGPSWLGLTSDLSAQAHAGPATADRR